ncbi:FMN-dependent NADH-azoreductase [Microbaculum marinum]|uniref:FMN dependent NADH:quinone oxidoreductase n=1 Tax=Microbaculum marinum TaxID=1764581 RepID=A0AAW9RYP7_9HYPH
MTKILFVTTSPRGESSLSTRVATTLVEELTTANPGAEIVTRDIGNDPLPHMGPTLLGGFFVPEDQQSAEQKAAVALSDELVAEVKSADIIVIASAMINFSITSTLKSWLDHLARAGLTFQYTEDGHPVGLVTGKKVYVVLATGAVYSAAPLDAIDFQAPYLKHMLGFMGMTDVDVVRVEGSIFSPEAAEKAVRDATARARAAAHADALAA